MGGPVTLVEIWRGEFLESVHAGHAVVCDADGEVVEAWGNPQSVVLPRSSCKMIQALPLVESGAAEAAGLTDEHLALACASHRSAAIHTDRVGRWLHALGLDDDALRCGPQMPSDQDASYALIRAYAEPKQMHNNCSGKHTGFLTLAKHLGGGPEYIDPGHPVQLAVRAAFEEVTDARSPGYAIDGCSAPNFATRMAGLARAVAKFAAADPGAADVRSRAMVRLRGAMMAHPELVSGEGGACTALMRAAGGKAAVKTGAEGVYVAILPDKGLGIAVKAADGAGRAAETIIAALLVRYGALDPGHPVALAHIDAPIPNRRGIPAAFIRPVAGLVG